MGRNIVHTLPVILIVAHCSLCRTVHTGADPPGPLNRMSVATSLSASVVRTQQSRTCVVVTHLRRCSPEFHRTTFDLKPAIALCQGTRFTLHLWRLAPTSRLAGPYVHASRPLPKTPTGKLHPEHIHNRNQPCHTQVRISTESLLRVA